MISGLPGLAPQSFSGDPTFPSGMRGWEQFGASSEFPSISNPFPLKDLTHESLYLRKSGFLSPEGGAPELFLEARE